MTEYTLRLDSHSLFWKHGFNDGDMHDWMMDLWCFGDDGWSDGPYPYAEWNWRHVLVHLVEAHLLPMVAAAGHKVTTYTIDSNHNPIRIDFDDDLSSHDPTFPNLVCEVPAEQVLAAHLELKENPCTRHRM